MGGTGTRDCIDDLAQGIIPACAGNSFRKLSVVLLRRDHPRVCGEQLPLSYALLSFKGSSPRVRGTDKADIKYRTILGIIPACAGNSNASLIKKYQRRDHPRVCGEQ